MTSLIYLQDTYLYEYTTSLSHVGSDSRGSYIVCDETIFYPKGGGQPCDIGVIRCFLSENGYVDGYHVNDDVQTAVKPVAEAASTSCSVIASEPSLEVSRDDHSYIEIPINFVSFDPATGLVHHYVSAEESLLSGEIHSWQIEPL